MIDEELRKQLRSLQFKQGAPKKIRPSVKEGTAPDERRVTYILKDSSAIRLKEVAKLTKRKIKEVAQEAIDEYLKKYDND